MTDNFFGFNSEITELAKKAESMCDFEKIEKIKEYNAAKVLNAFMYNMVSEQCF